MLIFFSFSESGSFSSKIIASFESLISFSICCISSSNSKLSSSSLAPSLWSVPLLSPSSLLDPFGFIYYIRMNTSRSIGINYTTMYLKILNSIWTQIEIVIQHQQNVNTEYQLLILNDDYLLNDMLIHVIDQQLEMLYLSLRVIRGRFCYHKGSLSFISISYQNGSDYIFNLVYY